ncbi:hypothetical protein BWI17_15235 [Betaproteobacteria bacterium GR16-43]|nr:hypothetical protein BWI17_15235 [Betaproteobacteria bacterium GR16-43]
MPSLAILSILAISAIVTSFISGILGMAGGMILMGILLAMLPLPAAMMLHGITQLSANGWRAWLWRAEVDWRVFRGYVYGSLLSLAVFIVVRIVVGKPMAFILLGLTPFIALALPEKLHLNVERRFHSAACGIICTVLSLTAGVSGPILDVFFVRSKMSRHRVVATKAMTQSFSHFMKIGYFGAITVGDGTHVHWAVAGMMIALAVIGTSLSRSVLEKMNDKSFRQWTRWTVMVVGVVYLGSGASLLIEQGAFK